jgi:DNA-binding transcriptional ArsR family regulator
VDHLDRGQSALANGHGGDTPWGSVTSGVDDRIGAVFAALADPTRRQVVRSLSRQPELTASRLAGDLPMTRQAVTKHLAALDRAGLVSARREGRETRYTLTPAPLAEAIDWMSAVGAQWDDRLQRLATRR